MAPCGWALAAARRHERVRARRRVAGGGTRGDARAPVHRLGASSPHREGDARCRAVVARCRPDGASSSAEDASIPSLAETSTSSPSSPSSSMRDPGVPAGPIVAVLLRDARSTSTSTPLTPTRTRGCGTSQTSSTTTQTAAVKAGCDKLRKRMRSDHSFATGRLSAVVPPMSEAYAALCNARALRKLRDASGRLNLVLGDYPVEARLYRPGSSMDWHQDVILYERPQVELIYTVVNDSDGRTEWVGSDGLRRGLAPPANSALVFEAGAAWHRVAVERGDEDDRQGAVRGGLREDGGVRGGDGGRRRGDGEGRAAEGRRYTPPRASRADEYL